MVDRVAGMAASEVAAMTRAVRAAVTMTVDLKVWAAKVVCSAEDPSAACSAQVETAAEKAAMGEAAWEETEQEDVAMEGVETDVVK